jgi:hypothetical protein
LDLVQAWHRAYTWWSESISKSERWKVRRTEWWLIPGLHQRRMAHRNSVYVPWHQRNIVWSEDVHVTKEKVCRPAAISRCRAFCSLLVVSEQFANLVDGDESPWVWTEPFFKFQGNRMFSGTPWKFCPRVAFCGCYEFEGKLWKLWTICSSPFPCCS